MRPQGREISTRQNCGVEYTQGLEKVHSPLPLVPARESAHLSAGLSTDKMETMSTSWNCMKTEQKAYETLVRRKMLYLLLRKKWRKKDVTAEQSLAGVKASKAHHPEAPVHPGQATGAVSFPGLPVVGSRPDISLANGMNASEILLKSLVPQWKLGFALAFRNS